MKFISKLLIIGAVLFMAAAPLVLAQVTTPPTFLTGGISDVIRILERFLSWMFTIFLIIAAIFIILAAFNYLTAGGDDEKIKTAKKQFIYAIVAIVIALIATGVRFVVEQLLR